jgi:hypothetical protein
LSFLVQSPWNADSSELDLILQSPSRKVKVTLRLTVSESVSLGVEPDLGLMTRYLLLFDSYGLVLWGGPSLTRVGICLLYVAGTCHRSLSLVRVPRDSQPYFTVSDLRVLFSSPPTILRVTMEVFDSASTRVYTGRYIAIRDNIIILK